MLFDIASCPSHAVYHDCKSFILRYIITEDYPDIPAQTEQWKNGKSIPRQQTSVKGNPLNILTIL